MFQGWEVNGSKGDVVLCKEEPRKTTKEIDREYKG